MVTLPHKATLPHDVTLPHNVLLCFLVGPWRAKQPGHPRRSASSLLLGVSLSLKTLKSLKFPPFCTLACVGSPGWGQAAAVCAASPAAHLPGGPNPCSLLLQPHWDRTGDRRSRSAAAPQGLVCGSVPSQEHNKVRGKKTTKQKKKKENARSSHSLPPATDSGSRSVPHFGSRVPPARTLCLHPPRSLPPPRLSVRPCGAPPGGGMMEPAGGPGEQSVGGGGGAWGVCGNPPHPERG